MRNNSRARNDLMHVAVNGAWRTARIFLRLAGTAVRVCIVNYAGFTGFAWSRANGVGSSLPSGRGGASSGAQELCRPGTAGTRERKTG